MAKATANGPPRDEWSIIALDKFIQEHHPTLRQHPDSALSRYGIVEHAVKDTSFFTLAQDGERLVLVLNPEHPFYHLTRYHGVFAPNHHLRAAIVPSACTDQPHPPPRRRLNWADLLKRVFAIDVLVCDTCGGSIAHPCCAPGGRSQPHHS